MLRPAVFVFFVGFLLSGAFAGFWEKGIDLPPLQMSQRQFSRLPVDIAEFPDICLTGHAASSFQGRRCTERWVMLSLRTLGVALPFLAVFLFFQISWRLVRGAYEEADTKLRLGKDSFVAVTTQPSQLTNDFYGWFHSLNAVSVQLKNGKQMKVYVPIEAGLPKPGAKLVIAPLGKKFGAPRAMGIVYIPHVSVVSG